MSGRDARLQELMSAGASYDDAERTIRKEEAQAQQVEQRGRSERAKKARHDKAAATLSG